jgi:serine-type D-Ala-D-Ala carboxypeptidase/endopeptidase (penicillin-binding protein 4)
MTSCGALRKFFLGVALWGSGALHAQDSETPYKEALSRRLSFILSDSAIKNMKTGVEVYSLSEQELLFSKDSRQVMTPASAVKLFTGYAALSTLGADFRYLTTVYAKGLFNDGVLSGDLYMQGGGDPSLVSERVHLLAEQFLRSGIKRVRGNLYVDASIFDDVLIDPKRIDTSTDRAYNASISGLSFNYNTTSVYFRPGDKEGAEAQVFISPDTGYIGLSNKGRTGKVNSRYGLIASRVPANEVDRVLVQGLIPLRFPEQVSYFNVTHPDIYAGYALKHYLNMLGVRVDGKILRGKVPSGVRKVAVIESIPLTEIVTLMNKFSNNFIADTLVKTMGYHFKGAPGTMDKGLEVMREEATKIGINNEGFKLVSGSGLTRENMLSAHHFIKMINTAYLRFDILPELLTSLPIAGLDGTLRSRLKDTAAHGSLRAKTGTINGVASLSGVVQSRGGELLAFTIILEDKGPGAQQFRSVQNRIAQALSEFNRKLP